MKTSKLASKPDSRLVVLGLRMYPPSFSGEVSETQVGTANLTGGVGTTKGRHEQGVVLP
jgi:hypothetical protein